MTSPYFVLRHVERLLGAVSGLQERLVGGIGAALLADRQDPRELAQGLVL